MSRREEGELGDPKSQEAMRRVDRFIGRRNEEDLRSLVTQPQFMRFMGRLLARCGLTDDLATNNGGDLQRFMGRRSIAVEVLNELEPVSRGFYLQVLNERQDLLRQAEKLQATFTESTDE